MLGVDLPMKSRALLTLLLALLLLVPTAWAEGFTPIPWSEDKPPYAPHDDCFLPDNAGYHDDSLDVRVETFTRDGTNVMAVYVTIADPSQLRTGTVASNFPSKKVAPVSALAKKYRAVLAINGDYFAYHNNGIVVRNTRSIRMEAGPGRDTLIIDENGDFTILHPTSAEAFNSFEGQVVHAFCFGPGLVIDGEPLTDLDTVSVSCGKERKTQRIAIGQLGPLQYLILTCEGPENTPKNTQGFDLLQMAALCKELGCVNAYNLDGGSSSTIALNYKKINALSSRKIRSVGDAIYFVTLVP